MNDQTLDAAFEEALDDLKRLAISAPQPGESPEWRSGLASAAERFEPTRQAIATGQRSLLDAAEAESPALASHVAQLRAEASSLADAWSVLVAEVASGDLSRGEPPASGEHERVRTIREDLMAWVDRARASHRDIRGTHVEAFYRDRGVVD